MNDTMNTAALEPQLGAIALSIAGKTAEPKTVEQARMEALARRFPAGVPAWRLAFEEALRTDPRGAAGVAEKLGVSRPYVSRVYTFHMPVAPQSFAERVTAVYMRVDCPHLCRTISPEECRQFHRRTFAVISQFEVDHWRACQRCSVKAGPAPINQAAAAAAAAVAAIGAASGGAQC